MTPVRAHIRHTRSPAMNENAPFHADIARRLASKRLSSATVIAPRAEVARRPGFISTAAGVLYGLAEAVRKAVR